MTIRTAEPRIAAQENDLLSGHEIGDAVDELHKLVTEYHFRHSLLSQFIGISQTQLSKLLNGRQAPSGTAQRHIIEAARMVRALSEIAEPDSIAEWFDTPNDLFQGFSPLEVIRRGHSDRVWTLIHHLHAGTPL